MLCTVFKRITYLMSLEHSLCFAKLQFSFGTLNTITYEAYKAHTVIQFMLSNADFSVPSSLHSSKHFFIIIHSFVYLKGKLRKRDLPSAGLLLK